ncbi:MAG: hypothetical protein HYW05_01435 [Candidatus Diapherotrites archaeon]|nr:hypothetical protein [Candidatus Diapherotrites archaeon]
MGIPKRRILKKLREKNISNYFSMLLQKRGILPRKTETIKCLKTLEHPTQLGELYVTYIKKYDEYPPLIDFINDAGGRNAGRYINWVTNKYGSEELLKRLAYKLEQATADARNIDKIIKRKSIK